MSTNGFRAAAAGLLVATSIGVASGFATAAASPKIVGPPAPGVSQADSCGGLQAQYGILKEGMAQENPSSKTWSNYRRTADATHREAVQEGCAWAQ
ncbi:hypothetical protein ACFYVR_07620 [Rhodococcus sp. NPDC003318]|uniref:hypothetical protein n=1 Tax=Rhodococcus sp. NPDC003318 TaxID=3364503 RepID=UPI0036A845BD